MGDQLLSLKDDYISNLSLLLGLEPFKKFEVVDGDGLQSDHKPQLQLCCSWCCDNFRILESATKGIGSYKSINYNLQFLKSTTAVPSIGLYRMIIK